MMHNQAKYRKDRIKNERLLKKQNENVDGDNRSRMTDGSV